MSSSNLKHSAGQSSVFWGEIAPSEHIAQFYETDDVLLDALAAYVGTGLQTGESAVVIATPEHLAALQLRLKAIGIDLVRAILDDRYITVDAETALASFMVGQWPDDQLFGDFISRLLTRATVRNRRARAFGEMVALLWARGDVAATVRLEHLWEDVCQQAQLPLFCAYPRIGATMEPSRSFADICAAHSKVVPQEASAGFPLAQRAAAPVIL